jgi:hypothetical protein
LWSAAEKTDAAVIGEVKKLTDKVTEATIRVVLYDSDDDDDLDNPRNLADDVLNLLDVKEFKFPPLMLGCTYPAKRFCLYPQTDVLIFCGYSFTSSHRFWNSCQI